MPIAAALCLVVLAHRLPVPAQPQSAEAAPLAPPITADTRLAGEDLLADLTVLRRALTELHPGLYRSSTPEQLEARFDALGRSFSGGRTLREAYLELSAFLATIRCGHTYANFFNQRKPIAEALFGGATRLPFAFRWLDREMVVTASADPRVPRGARITSIDAISSTDLLASLMPLARADGANDAKRTALMNVGGLERLESFDVFSALLHPPAGPTRRVTFVPPQGGDALTLDVGLLTEEQRRTALAPPAEKGASPSPFPFADWTFRTLDEGTAYLRMDSWVMYKTRWDWRRGINELVDRLIDENAKDLIVDLRSNEGGDDCGQVLLARLIDRPLTLPGVARYVRAPKVPADLNPYLDTWDDSFRDWGKAATPAPAASVPAFLGSPPGGFWTLRRDDDDAPDAVLAPAGRRFTGRLWVLVGPTNSSATFQFARTVQRTGLGKLVGTPTGGSQRGINGGCFFFVRLPRTGLEVDLPLIAECPAGTSEAPDAGLTPDILVTTTAADVAAGRDPELAAALKEIAAGK